MPLSCLHRAHNVMLLIGYDLAPYTHENSRQNEPRMVSSGMLRRVALVRTDVSEEPGATFIRMTRICELGTTQAATSNRRTLRTWYFFAAYAGCYLQLVLFLVHRFLSP
jgi:hypothetical protein